MQIHIHRQNKHAHQSQSKPHAPTTLHPTTMPNSYTRNCTDSAHLQDTTRKTKDSKQCNAVGCNPQSQQRGLLNARGNRGHNPNPNKTLLAQPYPSSEQAYISITVEIKRPCETTFHVNSKSLHLMQNATNTDSRIHQSTTACPTQLNLL